MGEAGVREETPENRFVLVIDFRQLVDELDQCPASVA